MSTQSEKAERFAALHKERTFIIPNPWDAGSAVVFESLQFQALATTSAGFAFADGMPDMIPTKQETLQNAKRIVEASNLPVSADLVDGFGRSPDDVAATILDAAGIGLVGASIEDAVSGLDDPILPTTEATARIAAAADAARSLPFKFTLTARAENYFHGRRDLDDTISRLRAYADAGADVVYAPGVVEPEEIQRLIQSVNVPVNVLAGIGGNDLSISEYERLGARRISFGSMLWGVAAAAIRDASQTLLDQGDLTPFKHALSYQESNELFTKRLETARFARTLT